MGLATPDDSLDAKQLPEGERSLDVQQLLEADRRYVWHPMTPHQAEPALIVTGEGCMLTDVKGERYFDGMSGLWCVNVGHGREEIAKAAYNQIRTLAYTPLMNAHVPAIRLSEKLNEWLGGEYRIFYSNSGSDANEVAFKIARQFHAQNGEPSRTKFISRYRAYHGNSMGALAATGQAQRKLKYEPLGSGFVHVPPPYCYRCPFGQAEGLCKVECAAYIEEVIQWEGASSIAGMIIEPVITGGGMIVPPASYMEQVQRICSKHGLLLIVDEVICGFGRSGHKFGHHNYSLEPDIVTMAKGLTSGYTPLSATAVRAGLYEAFKGSGPDNHFRHVNTFGGNPASCAIALENVAILEREDLVSRSSELGVKLADALQPLRDIRHVGDIRSFGFMCGIELVEDKLTKEPAVPDKVQFVMTSCKKQGLLIGRNGDTVPGYANILTLAPPFITTDAELEWIISVLTNALKELEAYAYS
ncbi:aspartate aminotransferase family protein [Paenibacillus sp. GCM10023252]|uniref:aspartate aminotransferase family protein n=1 Tax=Paenibacillus sp. GCM10023252 TaxID=3252649 RepID=UPI00361B166E